MAKEGFIMKGENYKEALALMKQYKTFVDDIGKLSAKAMPVIIDVLVECKHLEKELEYEQKSK